MTALRCSRTRFTDEQKDALESFISKNPRLHHEKLEQFAREHHLTISSVRNWVNNRKQRMKRDSSSGADDNLPKCLRLESSSSELIGIEQQYESSTKDENLPSMLNTSKKEER